MADPSSGGEGTHPNLNLTPEEKRVFGQLFQAADTENVGVVTGEVAVKFFERTKLDPLVLGEIADTENRGFLTPSGFGVVLRLIGHVQSGRDATSELAYRPGPLPKFDGFGSQPKPLTPTTTSGPPLQPPGPIRVPPLTPEKVSEFSSFFDKSPSQNGILGGAQAKQIFERARLPNDVLEKIWNLVDTGQQGALGVTEFIIAMHLLTSYKSGAMKALPTTLPPGLYDAAARRSTNRPGPALGGVPPVPSIPQQFSGSNAQRSQSPLSGTNYSTPPISAQATGSDWLVGPKDKAQFDNVFASVDRAKRGYITGDEAVRFFGNSRLPAEILAQIWDLSCINSNGQLNKDEFAVAMFLIRQQRGTRDGRGSLPPTLPPQLVPPSMRQQSIAPSQPSAPAFKPADRAPQTIAKSATEDLFGLDAFSTPAPAQAQSTGEHGTFNRFGETDRPGSAGRSLPPGSPSSTHPSSPPHPQTSGFKAFIPSSSFGQSITTTTTGGSPSSTSAPTQRLQQSQQSAAEDLLGDNDPEVSRKLTAETTELANLSNQVGSLSKQMQEVKSKRSSTEQDLSNASSQKRAFESRLSQLRTLYEQEVKDVRSLEERLNTSRNDIKRLQQDIAMIEGTYEDLQNQHRQVVGALQSDQQENAQLKEKMRIVNHEISELRPQLEKLKSDARQQKGLVAINKKQLATNEAERDRVQGEIAHASKAAEEVSRNVSPPARVQSSAAVISPTSTGSSQNPFFKRSPTAGSENITSPSPFAPHSVGTPQQNQSAFDDVFGPSFSSASSVPPPTSFQSDSEARGIPTITDPSGFSIRSSDGPDDRTPTSTPPTSTYNETAPNVRPPPPPESRQITSSNLPLRDSLLRSDSVSSSVKVSAPASRYGGNDTSAVATPTNIGSPITATPTHEGFDASQGFGRDEAETTESGIDPMISRDSYPSTSQVSNNRRPGLSADDQKDSFRSFGAPSHDPGSIPGAFPGAFPGETTPPAQQPSITESTLWERKQGSADPPESSLNARSESYSQDTAQANGPASASSKDDFDAAFAGFTAPKQAVDRQNSGISASDSVAGPGPSSNRLNKEFPPIEEFGNDDDSESASEQGFDDNFTSASPHRRQDSGIQEGHQGPPAQLTPATGDERNGMLSARPPLGQTNSATSSLLPSPGAQTSPPTYDETVTVEKGHRESNQFPPEFTGLLPSRDDPTSPEGSPEQVFTSSMNGGQVAFGEASLQDKEEPRNAPQNFAASPQPNMPSYVPIGRQSSTASQPSVSQTVSSSDARPPAPPAKVQLDDDFDKDFADLADAQEADEKGEENLGMQNRNAEDFDDFNPVFDSPSVSTLDRYPPEHSAAGSADTKTNGFNEFEQNVSGPVRSSSLTQAPQAQSAATSEDWDAIFAGLDSKPEDVSTGLQGAGPKASLSPHEGAASSSRPNQLPRALSTGTEHDDPILKKLTSMGYPREASLGALEKYDYNIDKAADYLIRTLGK
ncbi:MAG: hypothetical protein M1833_006603 [Piccolia ochrophora]|nr:MAG: hypothetical protein M1833_006603 [Piccolia ochrophora]